MTDKGQSLAEVVQEAVAKALADALLRLAASAPSRAEFEALQGDIEAKSLSAALAALGGNGRLAAAGGNLVIDYGDADPTGGFTVRGDKAKYKVIALREWLDGATNPTPVGGEGSDVTKLQPTWDYLRMHP